MFGRRRDVSRILLRDDLLPAKAAYDPRRTSARPGWSRPGPVAKASRSMSRP